jgi:hypothetical protein
MQRTPLGSILGLTLMLVLAVNGRAQGQQPEPAPVAPAESEQHNDSAGQSTTELAKGIQNPIADLISFPFQNNANFNYGPLKGTQNILNIQPVIPIHLSEDWILITRTIFPLTWQPALAPNTGSTFGLSNVNLSLFLSPKEPFHDIIWGVGPVIVPPTATSGKVGSNIWGAGPTAVALRIDGPWVYGALVNNVWSSAGTSGPGGAGNAYNKLLLQPFINYNFGEGWYVNTVPILTSNWLAPAGQQWIVPVGGGVGRVIKLFDKLPVNLYLGAYYNVIHPSLTGPSWQLRSQLTFIF